MSRIKIDLDRTLGEINHNIFGNFVEHLGRCIYGGVYEEGSPLSDERGFRQDVLEAARGLHIPVLRWPGGNFVSGYHWTDGVGPKEQRPRRMELAWHAEESNRFGTDEFMEYCKALGTEPYLCVNMGTGTVDEAQAWVEYCNGTGDTYWANMRRANGHEEPYNVKYWGLGNEMYGPWQIGALTAEEYSRRAIEFAKVMKWTDPSIRLVSCGENGWSEWDRVVIDQLVPHVDYHSIHIYTGNDDYYTNVFQPHQAERALEICGTLIERARYQRRVEHPVYIAYDEWNVWFQGRNLGPGLEQRYTLSDALAVATYLNIFIRKCEVVKLANLAQMVNVIAPIFTSSDGTFLQAIYHPLRLYAEHTRELALDVYTESDSIEIKDAENTRHRIEDLSPFEMLDVSASRDVDGRKLTIGVVNRSQDRDVETAIELQDANAAAVKRYEVNASDVVSANNFDSPDEVNVSEGSISVDGGRFEYTFPAHSLTLFSVQLG